MHEGHPAELNSAELHHLGLISRHIFAWIRVHRFESKSLEVWLSCSRKSQMPCRLSASHDLFHCPPLSLPQALTYTCYQMYKRQRTGLAPEMVRFDGGMASPVLENGRMLSTCFLANKCACMLSSTAGLFLRCGAGKKDHGLFQSGSRAFGFF